MQRRLQQEQQEARTLRSRRRRLSAQIIVLAALVSFVSGVFDSPLFWLNPAEVRVVATDTALGQAVAEALELPAEKSSLFYPLSEVERQIRRLPQVQSVTVTRHLPRGLVVEVQRREPVAVVQGSRGLLLVGEDGVVVARVAEAPAGLPVLTGLSQVGEEPGERLAGAVAEQVAGVSRALERVELGPGVRLECGRPFDLRLQAGGTEGLLGGADNLERKIVLFGSLLEELREQGHDPAYLDVRVMQRPVWRPRGAAGGQ